MDSRSDNLPTLDDHALVKRAVRGDGDAFGMLYERHLDAIYRYIHFRVGDELHAEDMTEEVFVKAWEALPRYKAGQHPFTSWLYRIAHNLVVDHHRKRQTPTLPTADLERAPDGAALPEALLVKGQTSEDLACAVQQLDEEAQQVVILRFVEGLSHREVAHIIGKSESASRVIQHRALTALHALLTGQEKSPDG